MIDKKLFEILVCPMCHGNLHFHDTEIICRNCSVAFPICDDIPVMLESEARTLTTDERLNKKV